MSPVKFWPVKKIEVKTSNARKKQDNFGIHKEFLTKLQSWIFDFYFQFFVIASRLNSKFDPLRFFKVSEKQIYNKTNTKIHNFVRKFITLLEMK